jgi:CBS domain containing-hemolysin-like protein
VSIWIHGIAFVVAFSAITAAHLVFGEQAPKIFALLVEKTGQLPKVGDRIDLEGAVAEVLEVSGSRASRIRMEPKQAPSTES